MNHEQDNETGFFEGPELAEEDMDRLDSIVQTGLKKIRRGSEVKPAAWIYEDALAKAYGDLHESRPKPIESESNY